MFLFINISFVFPLSKTRSDENVEKFLVVTVEVGDDDDTIEHFPGGGVVCSGVLEIGEACGVIFTATTNEKKEGCDHNDGHDCESEKKG